MRRLSTLVLFFLFFLNEAFAQNDVEIRFSYFSSAGFGLVNSNKEINEFLQFTRYSQLSRFEFISYPGQSEIQFNKLILKASSFKRSDIGNTTVSAGDNKSNFRRAGLAAMIGYQVYSNKSLTIYPLIGIEKSLGKLELTSSNLNLRFPLINPTPNTLYIEKEYFGLRTEISASWKLSEYGWLNFCIGYNHMTSQSIWKYFEVELGEEPKINRNSIYASLGIQISSKVIRLIIPKKN